MNKIFGKITHFMKKNTSHSSHFMNIIFVGFTHFMNKMYFLFPKQGLRYAVGKEHLGIGEVKKFACLCDFALCYHALC